MKKTTTTTMKTTKAVVGIDSKTGKTFSIYFFLTAKAAKIITTQLNANGIQRGRFEFKTVGMQSVPKAKNGMPKKPNPPFSVRWELNKHKDSRALVMNYIKSLNRQKRERLEYMIKTANGWLGENRVGFEPVTLERVVWRLWVNKGSFLSVEGDAKTVKGTKKGFLTGILYFSPHRIVGLNLCPFAKTCIQDCLFGAGRGRFANVSESRIVKTLCWALDPMEFQKRLIKDIDSLVRDAKRDGMKPAVRLNGTSDLLIERVFSGVLSAFPAVQFYDYTKNPNRFHRIPHNYDLTFSFDGLNQKQSLKILRDGGRVAVVFLERLPKTFLGFPVVDGDSSDLRFLDPGSVVVGLVAKGDAKKELRDSRFVVEPDTDSRCDVPSDSLGLAG